MLADGPERVTGRSVPIILSCVLLLLAAACGGEETSAPSAGGSPAGTGTGTAGAAGGTQAGGCASFEGQTVTFVVPYSPGGGYDTYTRLAAPYVGEELGATVVVENQEGAGGLLAINNLVTAAADGTTIAIMNGPGTGGAAIAGAPGANFELDQLSYVARIAASPNVLVTGSNSTFTTMDDVRAADSFRFGSVGPGGSNYVVPSVLIEILDLNAEIVTGFPGSEEIALALTRGDVDGLTGSLDSRIDQLESGDHRALLLVASETDPALPDTPVLADLELTEEQQSLSRPLVSLLELGRVVVAPPDVPEDRLTCLRDAFARAVDNPDLQAEAEELGRPTNLLSGEDVDALVEELLAAPPRFAEVLTAAYGPGS